MAHYVDNSQLTEALRHWVRSAHDADSRGEERPAIPDDIGRALLLIVQGVTQKRATFRRSALVADMQSHALVVACQALDKFDISQTNAFGFLTTTIHHACLRFLDMEEQVSFRHWAYARERHHGDSTVKKALADPVIQDKLAHHEARLATIRETRAEAPKPEKKRRSGKVTLPDGSQVTAATLGKMLGMTSTKIYRRLDAGKTVPQIMAEAEMAKTRRR